MTPFRSMSTVLRRHPVRIRILTLMFAQGFTEAEIARFLGISRQSVSYHLRQALAALEPVRDLVIDFTDD